MNRDQKLLEYLYEQITEGENRILKLEVEYAKIITNHAINDLTESVKRRIENKGKIRGERISDFIGPKVEHTKHLFNNEPALISVVYDSLVRLDVFSTLVYFEARRAYNLEAKDLKVIIIHPTMIVQYSGEANKNSTPFLDKQTLEEKLQKTIEETFVVRYNECIKPTAHPTSRFIPPSRKPWAEWRTEKLKYEKLTTKLPELEGVF